MTNIQLFGLLVIGVSFILIVSAIVPLFSRQKTKHLTDPSSRKLDTSPLERNSPLGERASSLKLDISTSHDDFLVKIDERLSIYIDMPSVKIDGEDRALAPKEYLILKYLAGLEGKSTPAQIDPHSIRRRRKKEIIEYAWEGGGTVHFSPQISRLNSKLRLERADHKYIKRIKNTDWYKLVPYENEDGETVLESKQQQD